MFLGSCALSVSSASHLNISCIVQNPRLSFSEALSPGGSKSSSAWTLATQVVVVGLEMQDRMGLLLFTTSTSTENIE